MKKQQLETKINPYESFQTYSEMNEIDKDDFFERILDPHNRYAPLIKTGAYIFSILGVLLPSIAMGIVHARDYMNHKDYSIIRNILERFQ